MSGISKSDFLGAIDTQTNAIKTSVIALGSTTVMDAGAMLGLQFDMNLFSQLMETTTALIGNTHDASKATIRNMKG